MIVPERHGGTWATVGLRDPNETKKLDAFSRSEMQSLDSAGHWTTRWRADYLAWDSEVDLGYENSVLDTSREEKFGG